MEMIKGYKMPSPNSGDGEYGGFAAYSASPAVTPYWGNVLTAPVPRLDGFGSTPSTQALGVGGQPAWAPVAPIAGAVAGYMWGKNPIAAAIGAALGLGIVKLMTPKLTTAKDVIDAAERAEEASRITPGTQVTSGALAGVLLPGFVDDEWTTPVAYERPEASLLQQAQSAQVEAPKPLGGAGAVIGLGLGAGLLYILMGD